MKKGNGRGKGNGLGQLQMPQKQKQPTDEITWHCGVCQYTNSWLRMQPRPTMCLCCGNPIPPVKTASFKHNTGTNNSWKGWGKGASAVLQQPQQQLHLFVQQQQQQQQQLVQQVKQMAHLIKQQDATKQDTKLDTKQDAIKLDTNKPAAPQPVSEELKQLRALLNSCTDPHRRSFYQASIRGLEEERHVHVDPATRVKHLAQVLEKKKEALTARETAHAKRVQELQQQLADEQSKFLEVSTRLQENIEYFQAQLHETQARLQDQVLAPPAVAVPPASGPSQAETTLQQVFAYLQQMAAQPEHQGNPLLPGLAACFPPMPPPPPQPPAAPVQQMQATVPQPPIVLAPTKDTTVSSAIQSPQTPTPEQLEAEANALAAQFGFVDSAGMQQQQQILQQQQQQQTLLAQQQQQQQLQANAAAQAQQQQLAADAALQQASLVHLQQLNQAQHTALPGDNTGRVGVNASPVAGTSGSASPFPPSTRGGLRGARSASPNAARVSGSLISQSSPTDLSPGQQRGAVIAATTAATIVLSPDPLEDGGAAMSPAAPLGTGGGAA